MPDMTTSIILSICWASFCWASWCAIKSYKDRDNLLDKRDIYFCAALENNVAMPKVIDRRLDWYYEEAHAVTPKQHFWRRFSFRNPWRLYGPFTISLVKNYPMDEEFWDWYGYVYRSWLNPYGRAYIIKRMAKDNWSRSNNPMSFMLRTDWDLELDDFRPEKNTPAMLEGALEYEEIMRIQDAVGQ